MLENRASRWQPPFLSYLAYLFQSLALLFLLAEAGVRTRVVVVVALFSVRQLSAPWLEGTDRKCNKYKMPPTWPPTTTASAARDRSNKTSARMEPERPLWQVSCTQDPASDGQHTFSYLLFS